MVFLTVSAEDDDGDQGISAAHFDSALDTDDAYHDRDAAPIVQAMQRIYDRASGISPELISRSVSLLPLPQVEMHKFLVACDGLPNLFEHSLWRFTPSELRLYSLANQQHWSQSELREVIKLIRDPSFIARDVGPDLESRVYGIFFRKI